MFSSGSSSSGSSSSSCFPGVRPRLSSLFVLSLFLLICILVISDRMFSGMITSEYSNPHATLVSHTPTPPHQYQHIQQQLNELQHEMKNLTAQVSASLAALARRPFTLDIVVARYREVDERDYLEQRVREVVPEDTKIRVLIYNKYDQSDRVLPNVGRDPHTILSHIISEYSTLADATFFLHGSFHVSPPKFQKFERILQLIREKGLSTKVHYHLAKGSLAEEEHFRLANWKSNHPQNLEASQNQPWTQAKIEPLGEWQKQVLGISLAGKHFSWHTTFLVGRDIIHRNSLQDYEKWRRVVAEGGENGEVMHYMERSFYAIFERPGDPEPEFIAF